MPTPPLQVAFDPTPEIHAVDNQGAFTFPLTVSGNDSLETTLFDEMRFLVSVWHPSDRHTIDLDRAYVELRGSFGAEPQRFVRLAEIEPVVPAYGADSFDGWIVLPVFAANSSFVVQGSGFVPRSRLQIRAAAYLVA